MFKAWFQKRAKIKILKNRLKLSIYLQEVNDYYRGELLKAIGAIQYTKQAGRDDYKFWSDIFAKKELEHFHERVRENETISSLKKQIKELQVF